MSNRAELELNLKDTGFDKAANDLRNLGTAAQTSGKNIQTTTTNIKNAETQSVSFGQKVKSLGSSFQSTVANVSTLGLSVVNLQRGYRDLGDAQIAVDRTNLKVNKSQEAVRKATDALATAQSKFGKNSKQAAQASLDLAQAQEKLKVDTMNASEAQERFGDIQQNFWMSVVPTITSAGGTMLSMFSNLAGDKGIGGLTSKLGSIKGGFSSLADGIGISSKALAGMSLALGGVVLGLIELDKQMKLAQWGHEFDAAGGASHRTLDQLTTDIAKAKEEMNSWGSQAFTIFKAIGQAMSFNPQGAKETLDFWPNVIKSLEQTQNRKEAIAGFQNMMKDIVASPMAPDTKSALLQKIKDITAVIGNDFNYGARQGVTAQQASDYTTNFLNGPNGLITKLMNDVQSGVAAGKLREIGMEIAKKVSEIGTGQGMQFPTPDQNLFSKALANWGSQAITKRPTIPQLKAPPIDTSEWFGGAFARDSTAFVDAAKKNWDDIAAASKAAAAASKAAWEQANQAELSGLDAILAAYREKGSTTVKKGKGHVTTGGGKLPVDVAADFIKQFEVSIAPLEVNPLSAQQFAVNWATTAGSKLKGNAGLVIKPIIDYINAHKNEAPDTFMHGFNAALGGFKPTEAMRNAFEGLPPLAQDVGTQTGTNLGKINTAPAVTKVKTVTTALSKILPQYKPTIAINDLASQRAKAIATAIAGIKSKTVTIDIKAKLDQQLGNILPTAIKNLPKRGNAGGWSGTVRRPTVMMVGEGGREEDISIRPRGSTGHSGGGGSGDIYVGPIYLDGQKVEGMQRYSMNKFQGTFK